MTLWELVSLELDKHAEEIGKFLEEQGMEIRRKDHKFSCASLSKSTICEVVNEALNKNKKRKLVVYGNGSYHHFTYGLCRHADGISQNYGYIHFDHHDDSYEPRGPYMNKVDCGGFVRSILDDTNASAALYIGSHLSQRDRIPGLVQLEITRGDLRRRKHLTKLKQSLEKLPKEVYLSFDLDVMATSVITTDYDQGMLKTRRLMGYISMIKDQKHIIGADVLGYVRDGIKSVGKELYARIIRSLIGDAK